MDGTARADVQAPPGEGLVAFMRGPGGEGMLHNMCCHELALAATVFGVAALGGCTLQAKMDGDEITLTDENGRTATVTIADVKQSNGVIHVIDHVLLPAS